MITAEFAGTAEEEEERKPLSFTYLSVLRVASDQ
jgi:hypothetical protein